MSDSVLSIGLPAGSLADPSRGGNLITLLDEAGFKTRGYESGGPSEFKTVNYLFGWDGRPQEFGSQLGLNELDVAIAGDDWIKERMLELKLEYNTDIKLEKVLSLNRGGVKIVGISNPSQFEKIDDILNELCSKKDLVFVVSEMPYLALNWLQEVLKRIGRYDEFSKFSVQKYKTPSKINKGIVIYETWGKTEAKVKNGGADLGIEITQTGSAIRNYGLKIIDTVMISETGIWINPALKSDPQKSDLLKMFLLNLYGCVNAENKVMILFNIHNSKAVEIEKYLKDNNLFADEPTKNVGKDFTEFSIQVDTTNRNLPIAKIRYELAKKGAVNIDTVPVNSSIPSIGVLGF
jgi:ATP phosphoribosyltransferase